MYFFLRLGYSADVVITTDGNNLHKFSWIVEIINLLNSFLINILLMASWQHNRKRETGITIDRWRVIEPCMLRNLPDEEAQTNIEKRLCGHQQNDQQIQEL